jgi:uncharacterized protein (TIGR04255 family)
MASGPRFEAPPVREVALTIYFDPVRTMQTLTIAQLRVDWLDDYPKLSEAIPRLSWKDPSTSFVDMLSGDAVWPMPLCEFINAAGDKAIQIQNDRFGIVWRFDGPPDSYPGHQILAEELLTRFGAFERLVAERMTASINVERVTIGYENYIDGLTPQQLAIGILTNWSAEVGGNAGDADRCALRLGYLPGEDRRDTFVALNVRVDPCAEFEGTAPAATLSLNATREIHDVKELVSGLEETHAAIIEGFLKITTDDMKRQWGGDW